MKPDPQLETYAAVDLGSNSFHLLVARRWLQTSAVGFEL